MADTKLAWIVGGSRGIGFACAEALAKEEYKLAISGQGENTSSKAVALLIANSRKATFVPDVLSVPCDITQEREVKEAYKKILDHFGSAPDVLINSAGISPWDTFSKTSIEEFDAVMAVNLRGMFLTTRAVLPEMYARGSGTIVQLLSVAGIKAYKNGAAYVASKYGARGLTNTLREEAREHGVRVIGVIPGATETELWDDDERKQYHDRMMQPEDIAHAIVAALRLPNRTVVEEIILRPIQGDI
ncbi:MAG TPA: SDR family oxidoreductase [Candidatus Kapabacteria bacterium]|nr:SDR family oxidoreductase [Candidatus Kapabacteria bacterium]